MDIARPYLDTFSTVEKEDLAFEFFMNRFRLVEPCPKQDFTDFTGQTLSSQELAELSKAREQGLIEETELHWQVTAKGRRYLNSLLSAFV